jgi:hypothetical protein
MVNISIACIVCSLSTSLSQNNYGTPFGPGYSLYLLRNGLNIKKREHGQHLLTTLHFIRRVKLHLPHHRIL